MGWLFTQGLDKKGLIAERIKSQGGTDNSRFDCLAHAVRGSVLYTVWEITKADGTKKRFIGIDLLRSHGGSYGYKDQEESMGVYNANDCPLYFFDMVPEVPNEYAKRWRQDCIDKANSKKTKASIKKALKVNDVVLLVEGCKPPKVQLVEVTPKLIGIYEGRRYKIAPRHIQAVQGA